MTCNIFFFFLLGKMEILLKTKGLFGWRSEKVEGWKIFSFPSYVFGWRDEKVGGWKTLLFG